MLGLDAGGGRTLFSGKPYRDLRHPMREVGTLLDAKAFHPTRKARSHLRMLAAATGVPDARVDEVLHMVGLESVAKKQPKGFSLGMGQRLGLAAALLGDPHTLILDEPANGLDPQGINWLRGFLKDFAASGRSVFVSSHLLAEMALMADHLVVIGKGRTIANESVADFVTKSSRSVVVVQSDARDGWQTSLHQPKLLLFKDFAQALRRRRERQSGPPFLWVAPLRSAGFFTTRARATPAHADARRPGSCRCRGPGKPRSRPGARRRSSLRGRPSDS